MRLKVLQAVALLLVLPGCGGCEAPANGSPADADAAAPSTAPTARPPASASSAPPPSSATPPILGELKVLKLVFTSDVQNKEPVDKLPSAVSGQRVWVHLTMRNRGESARPVSVLFSVNGDVRSKVDLKINPSWSYRTWAYNTLRGADSGVLNVEVVDGDGAVLSTSQLPISTASKR